MNPFAKRNRSTIEEDDYAFKNETNNEGGILKSLSPKNSSNDELSHQISGSINSQSLQESVVEMEEKHQITQLQKLAERQRYEEETYGYVLSAMPPSMRRELCKYIICSFIAHARVELIDFGCRCW